MDIADFLIAKKDEILRVAARHGARNVRVFGSVARGESGADSDVDLLVEMGPECTSGDLEQISKELAHLLGRRVDVATEAKLRPRVRRRALEEAIPLGALLSTASQPKDVLRMRRDRDRLLDIIEAIDRVHRYAPNLESLRDYGVESILVRNIQNIGEAASKLSEDFRQNHPEITWTEIIAMRHRIVHGYFDIDMEKVKHALESALPSLRRSIQLILDVDFREPG
jgi:uncharacterized protein with HEPN domain/predicted nucleotidyltransferase